MDFVASNQRVGKIWHWSTVPKLSPQSLIFRQQIKQSFYITEDLTADLEWEQNCYLTNHRLTKVALTQGCQCAPPPLAWILSVVRLGCVQLEVFLWVGQVSLSLAPSHSPPLSGTSSRPQRDPGPVVRPSSHKHTPACWWAETDPTGEQCWRGTRKWRLVWACVEEENI